MLNSLPNIIKITPHDLGTHPGCQLVRYLCIMSKSTFRIRAAMNILFAVLIILPLFKADSSHISGRVIQPWNVLIEQMAIKESHQGCFIEC